MDYKKGKWTEDEVDLLLNYYKEGYESLLKKGLNRSKSSTTQRLRKEGLYFDKKDTPTSWSEEEVKLLVDNYKKHKMAGALNCGLNKKDLAIRAKVRTLGLSGNENEGVLWNKARLDILNKYYTTEGASGVRKRGVKEPKDIIIGKAIELGLGVKF